MTKRMLPIVWIFLITSNVFAAQSVEIKALKGLKQVKIICDMNVGEPKLLLKRMELLDTTYRQLRSSGVKPSVVVAFRGKASLFITKADGYVAAGEKGAKLEVKSWIERFRKNGFTLEQCAIAADMLNIRSQDFLPEIDVVENGYISLIGYQQKGYAYLPMD